MLYPKMEDVGGEIIGASLVLGEVDGLRIYAPTIQGLINQAEKYRNGQKDRLGRLFDVIYPQGMELKIYE